MNLTENIFDTLRGKPYIAYENDGLPRTCGYCHHSPRPGSCNNQGIYIDEEGVISDTIAPHKYFKVEPNELLRQLDGKEVGNFCPLFYDFRNKED